MTGKLYVVGTPIGNLSDFSPRAAECLRNCDFIAAEDTRVTLKLLNRFDIKKPLISYFEHNRRERGEIILTRILGGESCALVTDAGMPAISDPGQDLVDICIASGVNVVSVPGPTAFATAVALSGLPSGRFTFEGFLSMNKKSRREHLEEVKQERRTMVFYEAPHKLAATLQDMLAAWGDRKIAIMREITKIHEEVIRTTLKEAAQRYSNENAKGELVLVIEGAEKEEEAQITIEEAVEKAKRYLQDGMSASEASKKSAQETGYKKGDIYRLLNIK